MSETTSQERRNALLCRLVVVLAAAVVACGFWGFSYDDNYITYRYAKNWAAGEGLVYNPGERVLGTSAPGYALVLGGLGVLGRPLGIEIHHWGTLTSALSWIVVAWVFQAATVRASRRFSLVLCFAAVAFFLRLHLHLLGAEAFPVLALVVLSAYQLFCARRPGAAGIWIAGAMFLRLDAGLAALVFGLVEWWRQRRFPLVYALCGLVPLGIWALFLHAYFGQIVPLTLRGKKALLEVPYTLRQWQMLRSTLPLAGSLTLVGGAFLGLVLGLRRALFRRPMVLALALWLVGHEIAYRALGVWFAPWYHLYLVHALAALFTLAVSSLARTAGARLAAVRFAGLGPLPAARPYFETACALLCLAPVLVPSFTYVAERWRRSPDPRYAIYAEAGRYLRENLAQNAEVLALEIGVLGYEAERRILDYGALVSPRFTAAKFTGRRPDLAAELAPAYIVDIEKNTMLREVVEHPALRDRYEVVASFEDAEFDHGAVRILRRLAPGS